MEEWPPLNDDARQISIKLCGSENCRGMPRGKESFVTCLSVHLARSIWRASGHMTEDVYKLMVMEREENACESHTIALLR